MIAGQTCFDNLSGAQVRLEDRVSDLWRAVLLEDATKDLPILVPGTRVKKGTRIYVADKNLSIIG